MKKSNLFLALFLAALLGFSCKGQKTIHNPDFLIGTWKIENKTTYESWIKINDSEYKGESYNFLEEQKQILETLSLKIIDDKIIYEANVPTQNDGKTIPFVLNKSNEDLLSFENLEHDFPKKIQYKPVDNSKILVNVFGKNDNGFSYYLVKQ